MPFAFLWIACIFSFLLSPAFAFSNTSAPLDYGAAEDVLYRGPSAAYFEVYDVATQGQCAPLLTQLNAALKSDDTNERYGAEIVYAELYDRALCVEFSPEKAFDLFKKNAERGRATFYAHVGWKYFYGHGVARSLPKAHEAFKHFMIKRAIYSKGSFDNPFAESIAYKGRFYPVAFSGHRSWLKKQMASPSLAIHFAENLIAGTAYSPITKQKIEDRAAGYTILSDFAYKKNLGATLALVRALYSGRLETLHHDEGDILLTRLAHCDVTEAMIMIAEFHQTGVAPYPKSKTLAYGWYELALKLGHPSNEQINTFIQAVSKGQREKARQDIKLFYKPTSCQLS